MRVCKKIAKTKRNIALKSLLGGKGRCGKLKVFVGWGVKMFKMSKRGLNHVDFLGNISKLEKSKFVLLIILFQTRAKFLTEFFLSSHHPCLVTGVFKFSAIQENGFQANCFQIMTTMDKNWNLKRIEWNEFKLSQGNRASEKQCCQCLECGWYSHRDKKKISNSAFRIHGIWPWIIAR